jgi:hypothetical protein
VLQRFERRLEGLVEGTFARAFKSELQPVEVASALQREMDERAAIVAQGRTLVPNDFVVELSGSDKERLEVYSDSLGQELSKVAREYASEQEYSFVGPVRIRFEHAEDLKTGRFRIRSGVIRGSTVESGGIRKPKTDHPEDRSTVRGHPRLLLSSLDDHEGSPAAALPNTALPLMARELPPPATVPLNVTVPVVLVSVVPVPSVTLPP